MKSFIQHIVVNATATAILVVSSDAQQQVEIQPISQDTVCASNSSFSPIVLNLPESLFSLSPEVARRRLIDTVRYKNLSDGRCLSNRDVPASFTNAVSFFAHVVIPSIEYKDANLEDVLQFISAAKTTPEPDMNRSIGLIYADESAESHTVSPQACSWSNQFSTVDAKFSCSLHRVNMLEFIQQLSKVANLDVGITQDGQIVFGRAGKWASINDPIYLLQLSE